MRVVCGFAVVLSLIVGGCNYQSEELEKRNAELQKKADELNQEMVSRDAYVESVMTAINDVYNTIEGVHSKEKKILRETTGLEGAKKLTSRDVRERLLKEISLIDSTLKSNEEQIAGLEKKVSSYRSRFAGLQRMVANLKQAVEEREQAIAELETKVRGLETQLTEKTKLVAQRDSVIGNQNNLIDNQHYHLITAYYIIGRRDELEQKGIIAREGGFLWGWLGSTTVLKNGFDASSFKPINKTESATIEVNAPISEIIPQRNERFYTATKYDGSQSILKIVEPKNFWQDSYLVIVTD
ncbi:MAG: hypothetical protein HY033_12350 [Ignavibacteriae bacterium]|nr:hypothetical protein [Ignavibacteria bacterium]MBI3365683.1 hypothetical protein [Ignavibacteriota bacterium]